MSKEIQQILNKLDSLTAEETAVLATVIDVEGSGYRLPGARMLITESGGAFGTVSGGCLESDVLERAQRIMETGKAEILIYDTTAAADSIFSLNMGCTGIVRILIEPVDKNRGLFARWRAAIENRKRQMVATLISAQNDRPVGGWIFYRDDADFAFEDLPDEIGNSRILRTHCAGFFDGGERAGIFEIALEAQTARFFFENIEPPLNLIIFGAGYDAIPLAALGKDLGWRVSVIDHRAAFASAERFPGADEIIVARPEEYAERLRPDENSAAVVMNHNYEKDREAVRFLLGFDLSYLGALGPKRRTEKLLDEVRSEDAGLDESRIAAIYAPTGLDIGGDTPETIALAIAAEIKSVLAERSGRPLRERHGSIYGRKRLFKS